MKVDVPDPARGARGWYWIPAAAAVACFVFLSLDAMTSESHVDIPPGVRVAPPAPPKAFTPPPRAQPATRRPPVALPEPPAIPVAGPPLPPVSVRVSQWKAGEPGSVYYSRDHGLTWSRVELPENSSILRVRPISSFEVHVETASGATWVTTDAGLHWKRR